MTINRRSDSATVGTHDIARDASTSLSDSELSPEEVDKSYQRQFGRVRRYLASNGEAYANFRRHTLGDPGNLRVISDVGFRELNSVGLKQRGNGVPTFQYIPPPADAVNPRVDGSPNVCVIHSFGSGKDLGALRRNKGRTSIEVDPETGFSPKRFFNGAATLISPNNQAVSIHHIVSRRGDLINSVSWDNAGQHFSGPKARELGIRGTNTRTIGIELEEWVVRRKNSSVHRLIDRVPYTEEQYAVIAFILKKFSTWIGTDDVFKWLGFSLEGLQRFASGEAGCLNHRSAAIAPGDPFPPEDGKTGHTDPGAEFFLPQGFQKGDSIPSFLSHRRGAYETRIDRWFAGVPNGTLISAWDRIFSKVARIRNFDLQEEVFDSDLASGPVKVSPPSVKGTGSVAAAGIKGRDRVVSVERANSAQGVQRSELYSKAQVTNAASATVWAEHNSKLLDVANKIIKLPVIVSALGFDFETGKWVNKDTRIVPAPKKIQERASES